MLKSLKRLSYRVENLVEAQKWYTNMLGAEPVYAGHYAVVYRVGNCALSLIPGKTPSLEMQKGTEIYWDVDDTDEACKALEVLGAQPLSPPRTILTLRFAQVIDPFGNIIGISSPDVSARQRSVENHPSESAMFVTYCRALGAKEDREEIRGPDTLAEHFLSDDLRKSVNDPTSRNWAIKQYATLYGGMIARTRHIDNMFLTALEQGIPQIVFLGAGYDTRSYRFADRLGASRIFEVDIATTQRHKRSILETSRIVIPPQVSFVSVNFKTDSLFEKLAAAGYSDTKKTFFIWEGVTYYLTEEAIVTTLQFMQHRSGSGSSLFFDYISEKHQSVYASEPMIFWIASEALTSFLAKYGFDLREDLGATAIEQRYLTLSNGEIAERVLPYFRYAHCIKG